MAARAAAISATWIATRQRASGTPLGCTTLGLPTILPDWSSVTWITTTSSS